MKKCEIAKHHDAYKLIWTYNYIFYFDIIAKFVPLFGNACVGGSSWNSPVVEVFTTLMHFVLKPLGASKFVSTQTLSQIKFHIVYKRFHVDIKGVF